MSPCAMAGQLFGIPMLSISMSISSGGMTARISRSIAAKRASVSSMRVPAGASRMQAHLAGIHVGKEILTDQARPAQRGDAEAQERRQHRRAMPQRPVEQTHVAIAQRLKQTR